ncbi:polysaccharide biosynthesis protein [Limnohabitans sp. TS-CS-82]|uniref:polysaccharide biosynthesis protein n=1 Tax=Limnohabitans sp. TS-CS-82 TaxID=2094193 RepID=UPI000CF2060C|nr:nucleoside-diphosphate sugar epimerase/dehydratase [Limnohabitans sp. TS-CS-82]PQA84817.1 polysaccharide biosynthesis protein [Limnohabitans sp. TS-CS-82]
MNKSAWVIRTLALPRVAKRLVAISVDVSLCVLTVWLAFYLRLGEWVPMQGHETWQPMNAALLSVAVALPIFITQGFYRAIFRYSGWPALMTVAKAMLMYGVVFFTAITAFGLAGVPRTLGLIQPMLLLLAVGLSRALARYWLGGAYQNRLRLAALPKVLVYGAGDAGRQLVRAMTNSQEMRVVGFLDDDDRLHGHVLNGQPIYAPQDLGQWVVNLGVTHVLLALPTISRARRNEILNTLAPFKVAVRTLPSLNDLAQGKVNVSDLRELDIDDLLGREPVQPNGLLLNLNTHGKCVVVTGAGGSIGSELCRQIVRTNPKQLLLVDMSEFALYQIHQELLAVADGVELLPLLASVCDEVRMHEIMDTWKPHTVYHAAAYKHVPMVEHNPAEGVRNNVWGTWVCAEAAARNSVRNFVLISTDKAVRPTNIMGATKRLAEMVLQAHAQLQSQTCFSMVRFGNVLGSSGSVVPLFREQIKNGGPITLTHAEITRYFMTIPEAAQLVIQAGAMGTGGDVFVLDMGEPVKIIDLARRMVELSGLTVRDVQNPAGDIELAVTGLRPGEKLFEELLIGDNPESTPHLRIMKAHEQFLPWTELKAALDELRQAMRTNDVPMIRQLLQQLVNGYQANGDVVDWVHIEQARQA